MKRYFLTALLFILTWCVNAQSINLYDLANLNTLTIEGAADYLTSANVFKLLTVQEVNGLPISKFQNIKGAPGKLELITLGGGTKNADGQLLREVLYESNQRNCILSMIAQASANSFTNYFRGNDKNYNIFLYDSPVYKIAIYFKLDESAGFVKIQQKDILPVY
jgi:hypothetical protein